MSTLGKGNACFKRYNAKGRRCQGISTFNIPVGQAWKAINVKEGDSCTFKVDYFKFGPSDYYIVLYNQRNQSWHCSCPYFEFNDCAVEKKCCKHIQSCIDKKKNSGKPKIIKKRGGAKYIRFMNEHIKELDVT